MLRTRTRTGRPVRQREEPPPEPPEPPEDFDEGEDCDGEDHGSSHLNTISIASSFGWEARYEKGTIPVIAWVVYAIICETCGGFRGELAGSLVLVKGGASPQMPEFYAAGGAEPVMGNFLGLFPISYP